ncbi:peptidoglycan-binding protein [bacterium]|nr:peptidoglycan-binding protein [Candidatus Elulimicrobium humile]
MRYLKAWNKFTSQRKTYEGVQNLQNTPELIDTQLDQFYKTLEEAAKEGGLREEKSGSMEYKKSVETLQTALVLLGYELPKFGVDGLFGAETSTALKQFITDNMQDLQKKETQPGKQENRAKVSDLFKKIFRKNESVDFTTLGEFEEGQDIVQVESDIQRDNINKLLLWDIYKAAELAGVTPTITTAVHDHPSINDPDRVSRHKDGTAVDIAIINGVGAGGATNATNGNSQFRELGNKLKDELVKMGYNLNSESGHKKAVLWQTDLGGNHFNHIHVSNTEEDRNIPENEIPTEPVLSSDQSQVVWCSPEIITKIIELLKKQNISAEDLQSVKGGSEQIA